MPFSAYQCDLPLYENSDSFDRSRQRELTNHCQAQSRAKNTGGNGYRNYPSPPIYINWEDYGKLVELQLYRIEPKCRLPSTDTR